MLSHSSLLPSRSPIPHLPDVQLEGGPQRGFLELSGDGLDDAGGRISPEHGAVAGEVLAEGLGPEPPRRTVRGHELGARRAIIDAVVVVEDAA